ncbi:MAG: dihydrodipicolinate synthase family protein [Candidatus Villigracilaceae bacterium]
MTNLHPLAGVYAAALTPLTPALEPDLEPVAEFLGFLAARGCHGALLFGTTGEGPSFSPAERESVMRTALAVRQKYPHFRLLAGTGTPSLEETIGLTRLAFDLGYDGVVCLPPYYFRQAGDDGLFAWFAHVIQKAVPADGYLLGYHFPAVAGIGFSLDLLKRLKDTYPQQFAGIKDSSHDENLAITLGQTFGSDLVVLTGTDSYLQLALENQAAGCITACANLIAPDLRAVYDAYQAGQDPSAVQQHVSAQRRILEKYMPFPPTLKALLARLHGFPRWPVKPPLVEIPPETVNQIEAELAEVD